MLSGRGIAAAYVSTDETHAQMDPFATGFEALFTALGVGLYVLDEIEVRTSCSHTA
jgi:hypothetical protein